MTFKDHFSAADGYARYRPTYPDALFDWLAAQSPARALAWDAGTGSGQAAVALADRFDRVVATDPAAAQIARAEPHPRVDYRVEAAERSSLATGSADLVTVAQALHWMQQDAFFAEATRVLKPGGVLAVWCYEVFETTPPIDAVVSRLYHDTIGPYWPPERRMIERGYADVVMPHEALAPPPLSMSLDWDLDALVGYLGTWSAVQRYRADRGVDPLPATREALAAVWGDPAMPRRVTWPLKVRASRRPRD